MDPGAALERPRAVLSPGPRRMEHCFMEAGARARRGLNVGYAGLIVCLTFGCADGKRPPGNAGPRGQTAGIGGTGTGGGAPQGAAGGSNAQAATGGGGAGGDRSCVGARPDVYACLHGAAVHGVVDGVQDDELTGVVQVGTDIKDCADIAGSVEVGTPGDDQQHYVVVSNNAWLRLVLRTPSGKPLLTPGEEVHVHYRATSELEDGLSSDYAEHTSSLSVRSATGEVLYWWAATNRGPEYLALPSGVTVASNEPTCSHVGPCGDSAYAGVTMHDGGEQVALEIGEQAAIGDYVGILMYNHRLTAPRNICGASSHSVDVALLPRDYEAKCFRLSESACASTEGCRSVRARLEGELSATFIRCVESESCSDDDAVTCAVNDYTDQLAQFTSTCIAPGWSRFEDDDCVRDDSDGGAP